MPPPNTPEELFEEEYRQRRQNSANASAASGTLRRRFNLPIHDEDSAESEGAHDVNSHPNTSQSESRRNSMDQPLVQSPGQSSSQRRHTNRDSASLSPSTLGPQPSDREADYAAYLRNPASFEDGRDGEHSRSASASTSPSIGGAVFNLSLPGSQPPVLRPAMSPRPAAAEDVLARGAPGTMQADEAPRAADAPQPENDAPRPAQPGPEQRKPKRAKTPSIDWHALEYVGTYDENLDCPICHSPLVQPEITTCFHIFCHKCLVQSLRHGNRCPIDRNPIEFFQIGGSRVPARPAPHIVCNQLDNLQVRCPNKRCDHVAARSLIGHHYKDDCAFTRIPCPDPSCSKLVTRRDSEEGSCLHKEVDCVYCGKPVELAELDDHYDTDCNQKELMCEHCLAAVPRHRHGTHVMGCAERRIECKFKTTGCAFASKKKDFGDHERTCLYGMILRMNRSHRADMESMETVLQDSQDRVRKLEAEAAARSAANPPPMLPLSLPPQMYELHPTQAQLHAQVHAQAHPPLEHIDSLSSYYDAAAAGDTLAHGNGADGAGPGTPPGSGHHLARNRPGAGGGAPSPDDNDDRINRIVAYIDIFDAKVENVERYLGEVDARQAQMFMNELGPLKDSIQEMRNSMGHMGMYVRWLMESFRQTTKRSVGLRSGGEDSSGRPAAPPSGPGMASPGGTANPAAASPPGGLRGVSAGTTLPPRRMSDRENPPRL